MLLQQQRLFKAADSSVKQRHSWGNISLILTSPGGLAPTTLLLCSIRQVSAESLELFSNSLSSSSVIDGSQFITGQERTLHGSGFKHAGWFSSLQTGSRREEPPSSWLMGNADRALAQRGQPKPPSGQISAHSSRDQTRTGSLLYDHHAFELQIIEGNPTFHLSYLGSPEDWREPDSSTEVCSHHTGFPPRSPGSGRSPETTNQPCLNCLDFWLMEARLFWLMLHKPKMENPGLISSRKKNNSCFFPHFSYFNCFNRTEDPWKRIFTNRAVNQLWNLEPTGI